MKFDPSQQVMYFPFDYYFYKFSGDFLSVAPAIQLIWPTESVSPADMSNICQEGEGGESYSGPGTASDNNQHKDYQYLI